LTTFATRSSTVSFSSALAEQTNPANTESATVNSPMPQPRLFFPTPLLFFIANLLRPCAAGADSFSMPARHRRNVNANYNVRELALETIPSAFSKRSE
jgi:hypothetical protein